MRTRETNLTVRVAHDELAQVQALAGAADLPVSILVRQWIRDHYRAKFGDVAPDKVKSKR